MGYRWCQEDLDKAKQRLAGSEPIKLPRKVKTDVSIVASKMNDQPLERESLYVGIDPDIHFSGVATWNRKIKNLKLYNLSFFDLTEFLSYLEKNFKLRVTIEAGWMIKKTNWHRESTLSKNEHISSSIGANHQVGKLIGAYCERNNISYLFTKPRGKMDSATFKNYTKYIGRTNQEQRDAGMLVYGL